MPSATQGQFKNHGYKLPVDNQDYQSHHALELLACYRFHLDR